MNSINECISCFLRYRSFPHEITPFKRKKKFNFSESEKIEIFNELDLLNYFSMYFKNVDFKKTGIMLSGGIDSCMVAAFMPKGSLAFTISYPEMKEKDETERAKFYANKFGLKLIEVDVTFDDIVKYQDELMKNKEQPLSSIEIGMYKMCLEAKKHGLENLLTGMGADGLFGGFFNLLSRQWTNSEFVERFTYIDPNTVLLKAEDNLTFFKNHFNEPYFNMLNFLDDIESEYSLSYFLNPCETANIKLLAPYENCIRKFNYDFDMIRNGNEKPILRKAFEIKTGFKFEGRKMPFPRPTEYWYTLYKEKLNPIFKKDAYSIAKTPEQKWIIYSANHFINLFENKYFQN